MRCKAFDCIMQKYQYCLSSAQILKSKSDMIVFIKNISHFEQAVLVIEKRAKLHGKKSLTFFREFVFLIRLVGYQTDKAKNAEKILRHRSLEWVS